MQVCSMTRAAVVALLALVPGLAGAEECAERDAIIALSGYVLEQRLALPHLQARSFGAEAAFLTIRYTPLDDAAAAQLLASLDGANIRGLADLATAWAIDAYGPDVALADLGPAALDIIDSAGGISTLRALLLAHAGKTVLDHLATLPEDSRHGARQAIYAAIIDQPDALKLELARAAIGAGDRMLAGALAATARDPAIWQEFIAGIPDAEEAAMLTQVWRYVPTFVGNPPLDVEDTSQDPAAAENRRRLFAIGGLLALQPEFDLLNMFVNVSGLIDPTYNVAMSVRAAFEDGTLDRHAPLDQGWRFTYRALRDALDDDGPLDAALVNTAMPGGRVLRPMMADVLEWSLAAEALGPYLRGEADDLPQAPEGPYGLVRDWSDWVVAAGFAKSAPMFLTPGDDERDLAIAAELLFEAGKGDAIGYLLERTPVSLASVSLAADLAQRMDRNCAAYTWHLAEAAVLAGTPIYKFDDPLPLETAAPPATAAPITRDDKAGGKNS